MTSVSRQFNSVDSLLDQNNNHPLPIKSYSLRPRTVRRCEEAECMEHENARPSRRRKQRSVPLSKYRRKTANARERSRMREINEAFEQLRRVIPQMTSRERSGEKLTKISTLRLAMKYISALDSLLQGQVTDIGVELPLNDCTLQPSASVPDYLTSVTPLGDAPSACPAPMPLEEPCTSFVFDVNSYLLDDVPLLMEFS